MKYFLFFIPIFLFGYQEVDPFEIVNDIRYDLDMTYLKEDLNLDASSKNHAKYVVKNHHISHIEDSNKKYFTGKTPGDRALYEGYPNKYVLENFSYSSIDDGGIKSVKSLMSAIYHRFGFLSFDTDVMGFGHYKGAYVYNLGNSYMKNLCRKPDFNYGIAICENGNADYYKYEKARYRVMRKNPKYIIYPRDEQADIPVAFFEEIPDPLPDYHISGYPISISFNEGFYTKGIKIKNFKLYDNSANEIQLIKHKDGDVVFNYRNDPNKHLTKYQFAIFPKHRLSYNSQYHVHLEYVYNNILHRKDWSFNTEKISNLKIVYDKNRIKLKKDEINYLFFDDMIKSFSYQCSSKVEFKFIDQNLIQLKNEYNHQNIRCTIQVGRTIDLIFQ